MGKTPERSRANGQKSFALFQAAHISAKKISASTIYGLLVKVLGRPIKSLDDPPSDYYIPNVIAYADYLNHTEQFRPYHLSLQQADVVNVHTMGDLGGAIVSNFQTNGWTVTPD